MKNNTNSVYFSFNNFLKIIFIFFIFIFSIKLTFVNFFFNKFITNVVLLNGVILIHPLLVYYTYITLITILIYNKFNIYYNNVI